MSELRSLRTAAVPNRRRCHSPRRPSTPSTARAAPSAAPLWARGVSATNSSRPTGRTPSWPPATPATRSPGARAIGRSP